MTWPSSGPQSGRSERLPYLVLFLDRWEGFLSAYPVESGSTMPAALGRLIREGPGAGLRVVLSGDRGLLTDRLAAQIDDRLVLRLADRDDYRLAGINPREVAADVPPGRAFRADSAIELQVAVLGLAEAHDPSGPAQADAVRAIAAAATAGGLARQDPSPPAGGHHARAPSPPPR